MINDSQTRLDELEASYKRLQESNAKLKADFIALGGKVSPSHEDGAIDPYDEAEHIVLQNAKFLTKEELAAEVHASFVKGLGNFIKHYKAK